MLVHRMCYMVSHLLGLGIFESSNQVFVQPSAEKQTSARPVLRVVSADIGLNWSANHCSIVQCTLR